jgi:OOP family OmpA-OmpF porin
MNRHPKLALALFLVSIALAVIATPRHAVRSAHAGLADKIKKKAGDVTKTVVDDASGKAAEKPGAEAAPADAAEAEGAGAKTPQGSGDIGSVSTKFDFVPGDKVLFADDFTQDDLGEFPARWALKLGTFEVAEMKGERWLRCSSEDGRVRMKLPGAPPERWTLEFDFFCAEPTSTNLTVIGLDAQGSFCWETQFPHGGNVVFRSGEIFSATKLEGAIPGRHHVMILARGPAVKVYFDRQRVANVPDVTAAHGLPAEFEFRLWNQAGPMITNVRYAEGPAPAADLLAGGKLVTHGIRFATGSDVVEPESAPILRQVAAWMTANPAAKLSVTGHTDNVGSAPSNLDLSKRRAAAVAKVLGADFAIAADRLTPDGKGDTVPMTPNTSAEGRAMNRRVEFAKL